MALKIALPKLDKRQMVLARARFKAWWDGAEFDEAAARAAAEAAANDADADADLFAAAPPQTDPRIEALQRVWGAHRVGPADAAFEAQAPARLQVAASGVVGVSGPGLAGPVLAMAATHPGEVRVLEWREETQALLRHGLAPLQQRATVTAIDLETFSAPVEALDALVSLDDFSFTDNATRLAAQFARALKPKAPAIVESYCASPGADLAAAYATAFREPQLRDRATLAALLDEAGLRVESDEDVTESHAETARAAFKALGDALRQDGPPSPAAARELAWEAEAWRVRLRFLQSRRIERRRFNVVRR